MAAYKANKPQGTDKFKLSPADINTNFTDLKNAFDINHVALTGTGGHEGKHYKIDLTRQAAAPVPAVTDLVLYNAYGATLVTKPQIWWIRNNVPGPGTTARPITEGLIATYPANGWFRHGSGVLVKFGQATVAHGGPSYTISFPIDASIPAFVTIPMVLVTVVVTATAAKISMQTGGTLLTFKVFSDGPNIGGNLVVNYLAIGS